MTTDQYANFLKYKDQKQNPTYSIPFNQQCTQWAIGAALAGKGVPPSVAAIVARGLSTIAFNPATLSAWLSEIDFANNTIDKLEELAKKIKELTEQAKMNPRAWDDMDGNGVENRKDFDTDGDGLFNDRDPDIDEDGIQNEKDEHPYDPRTINDIDGDGIANDKDLDMDGDKVPNDQDDDTDGDGIPNSQDPNPADPRTPDDIDGDGIPNLQDPDRDGDAIPNDQDENPDDPKDQPLGTPHAVVPHTNPLYPEDFNPNQPMLPPPPTPEGAKDILPNTTFGPYSPLILDLDADGVETRSVAEGIQFDLDNNGFRETVGWVGADDGLLALDKNGDGLITGGTELFGDQTILVSGGKAANGFSALADYDDNKDGRIDANDAVFSQLKVWRDLDADGVSDAGELIGLAETGVARLNLTITASSGKDAQGNDHRLVGSYVDTGGANHTMTDVWFTIDPTRTTPVTAIPIPEEIKALPDAQGFGNVRSLRETMALDGSGKLKQLVEEFVAATDAEARKALLPQLMFQWIGGKFTHQAGYPADIFSTS
ncbi:MAG: hypothetical protein V2B20_28300, partial [Pseudomonadota bacterium]